MWGPGATQFRLMKKKLNTLSSMEAEVVGVDDMLSNILWTILFIEDRGWYVENNHFYQYNKRSIHLEKRGRNRIGNRTQAMSICEFFIADQVDKENMDIENFPTDGIVEILLRNPFNDKSSNNSENTCLGYKYSWEVMFLSKGLQHMAIIEWVKRN